MNELTLNNHVRMPVIGYGTWDIRGEAGKQSILTALDLGYRLIDTAQMYENEYIVGYAVKESGIPREELFLTTKIYRPRTTYQKAKSGIEQSLNELQTDYIDLLLIHEPYKSAPEMYEAFKEALRDGKVRAIGISNFDAEKYKEFVRSCEIIPAVNQVESHVYFPQLELKNLLNSYGTQMQSWASFTEGRTHPARPFHLMPTAPATVYESRILISPEESRSVCPFSYCTIKWQSWSTSSAVAFLSPDGDSIVISFPTTRLFARYFST